MTPTLDTLEAMARGAGEILRQGFGAENRVYHKGVIDLVTDIDRRSETYLLGEIQRQFPNDRVYAEESGAQPGQDCCVWYVDPLDGTINYAHNLPIYCVSIAYEKNGELELGVVYDPAHDECYCAQRGAGAWLNGAPLQVPTSNDLDQSLLVTGFAYDIRTNPNNNLAEYNRFALRSQGVRRLGSAALDLCYVAAGRFDGYWELDISSWDIAAGALVASEAGAKVTAVYGESDYITPPCSILAAHPALHAQMLEVLLDQ